MVSTSKKGFPPPIDWKAVGRRLRQLRGFDLTQTEFAEKIGVSQGYLSSAERGQREIGPEILLRISFVCDRSIEWLLTGKTAISCDAS
jgi:transcriptional regulator with XRE-family HTH domain